MLDVFCNLEITDKVFPYYMENTDWSCVLIRDLDTAMSNFEKIFLDAISSNVPSTLYRPSR